MKEMKQDPKEEKKRAMRKRSQTNSLRGSRQPWEEMCVEEEEEVGSGDFVRSQRIRILSVLIERRILHRI